MKKLFSLFCGILFFSSVGASERTDSLLNELDRILQDRHIYEKQKEEQIVTLKRGLRRPGITPDQQFELNHRIFHKYASYICDSALHYVDINLELATANDNKGWYATSLLNKAYILSLAGLFHESFALLSQVDKKSLSADNLARYYKCYEDIYLYLYEYSRYNQGRNLYRMHLYRDSLLSVVQPGTLSYIYDYPAWLVEQRRAPEVEQMLVDYLPYVQNGTREYSIVTSILAFVYQVQGKNDLLKEYLIRSATSDIQAAVKENISLRTLAELLFEEGDIQRANLYIKISLEDANFFDARLRNVQSSKLLPIIDQAHEEIQQKKRKELQGSLAVISSLTLILLIAILFIISQMKKLSAARQRERKANQELTVLNEDLKTVNERLQQLNDDLQQANHRQQELNNSLAEANKIKEEYLGRFLDTCSLYIEKLEKFRRTLNNKAISGDMEGLYKTLKSSRFIEEELKTFYRNFDEAFLNIFPDFVKQFNELMPPEERLHPKEGEKLTTELRIFALIRLGISDSQQIADFLRYSITTIYTYRSKIRNRSLYKNDLEERVIRIGSFRREYLQDNN
ncbi:MAG: DUF6377 domain-containing protein [Bacteroides sp.]|nr:DUF6377 domain-containing protein [Bacteroides sp.]